MATLNSNPIIDYDADFLCSYGSDNYALVDEGMTRPNTADYTYVLDVSSPVNELFNFLALDNTEEITNVRIRVYISRTLLSTIVYKFKITDGVNIWQSASNITPPSGIWVEQYVNHSVNPLTSLTWTFSELNSYGIGIIATTGGGDIMSLATIALQITTIPIDVNKRLNDGLINIR